MSVYDALQFWTLSFVLTEHSLPQTHLLSAPTNPNLSSRLGTRWQLMRSASLKAPLVGMYVSRRLNLGRFRKDIASCPES